MTKGEWLFLGLTVATFLSFSAVLGYFSWVQSQIDRANRRRDSGMHPIPLAPSVRPKAKGVNDGVSIPIGPRDLERVP